MLTRVKTFVATGLATAGRLYAGDLNQIQDAAAAQSDYAQRVDVATLGIGESGLALLRYGTGEARLTGAMRTDAILRALGGLFAGQYTTAQRNAISAGSRPYGLIIWNTDTSRLERNIGTDATPNWQPVGGVTVYQGGTSKGTEGGLNFIAGSGITFTITDNPGTGSVDVTIAASAQAVAGIIPVGGMYLYGGASDPTNGLICDGRSLLRSGGSPDYSVLYGVIGTNFGFADGTHFNIPDFRGRFPVGVGTLIGLAANEGLLVNQRKPQHYHVDSLDVANSSDGVVGGAHLAPGHSPGGSYFALTSGNGFSQDSGAYLGVNIAIRFQ